MATLNFNVNDVEPLPGFQPLPAGKYVAVITDSELKRTRKGDGDYLKLTFEIIEGDYQGRKLWENINYNNSNTYAQNIGRATLGEVCNAVGLTKLNDDVELHNLPMVINVALKKDNNTDEMVNVIKKHESKSAAVAAPANTATAAKAPWAR